MGKIHNCYVILKSLVGEAARKRRKQQWSRQRSGGKVPKYFIPLFLFIILRLLSSSATDLHSFNTKFLTLLSLVPAVNIVWENRAPQIQLLVGHYCNMDWLRKLLGYHDRQRTEGNPFGGPTWDEIVTARDSQNLEDSSDLQHPWGHFFHGGFQSSDMFSSPEFEDSRLSVFGQMDDMFSHLESLMKDLHRHPAWTLPDSSVEPEPQTPRDYMLKVPDSDSVGTVTGPVPYQPPSGYESEDRSAQNDHDNFSGHADLFTFRPHSFFDRVFQNFGIHPGESPFSGHIPESGSASGLGEHSRESLIKREDSDIDERVAGDLSNLPEGRPGYSHDVPQTPDSKLSPWSHLESPGSQPGVQHKFYSKSIVTIRRPDGSIEETKKYTDSTGREEVTVTHKQPDSGNSIQPEGSTHQVPSIFSWFFVR